MTLGEKQRLFTRLTAALIQRAYATGYELSYGEAKRSDEQAEINAMGPNGRLALALFLKGAFDVLAAKIRNNVGSGIRGSVHELGLAVDFNLFKDGVYLFATEDYKLLGEYWESLDPLCCWGGRFGDGNHFSVTHEGKK